MLAIVNGPSLPKNIVNTKINLLKSWRCGVIPVDNPTVPKAETTSKSTCARLRLGSIMLIKKVFMHTRAMASDVITKALMILSVGIFLLKAVQLLLVERAYTLLKIVKVVVVLIPPPVEPGEAPINISIISTKSPALVNVPRGYVLKPAVLAEVL